MSQKNPVDWSSVDWSKQNRDIAEELERSPCHVCTMRKRLGMPRPKYWYKPKSHPAYLDGVCDLLMPVAVFIPIEAKLLSRRPPRIVSPAVGQQHAADIEEDGGDHCRVRTGSGSDRILISI